MFLAACYLAFTIDLLFAVVGYALTLRALDSHIRGTEPTLLGWAVALVCYPPLHWLVFDVLADDDAVYWDTWLSAAPMLLAAWGAAIVVLSVIYGLASAAFGLRFSNLTHRGIITGGPYRFSKHPAYLAKNLSWWLISVPFVSTAGAAEAAMNCAALLGINTIYYLRARCEERHLSSDPHYVAYALWIEEHGLLRHLGRWLPFLRYRPGMADA